ncbi:MAG: Gfo/Idh/MocA family oxidoreductase [Anaerolineae bacterium]|nr:Gfo/Idh/MocA family oxidoreductase [Anaerolineae bacterium]
MSEKIRWGILSTANIGRNRVIPAIQQSRNGKVLAVASRDLGRAREFADDLNIARAYGSYEELIADPDIDAIYNPLPNSLHAEWSIKCAEAGKPTLCEKPFASNAAEAQKMAEAFTRREVLFAEAFMYRFHPQTQKVKALVDLGGVGQITIMDAAFNFAIRPGDDANIRLSHTLVGGALMDVGCYCINVMRLMTGEEPQAGYAFADIGEQTQVDETLAGALLFPSGAVGHFDCSLRTASVQAYEIRGTQGRIRVSEGFVMNPEKDMTIEHWQGSAYSRISIPPANSYTLMAEDFADALIDGRPPKYAPQDGVENMKVIDMLVATLQ